MEKHVCNLCRTVGQNGANWIARVGDDKLRVHKPCGERLLATAPEGVVVTITKSPELRAAQKEQARAREVHDFWKQKFAAAGIAPR